MSESERATHLQRSDKSAVVTLALHDVEARQWARWARVAHAEGYASVGAWAPLALDAYIDVHARKDRPRKLAWNRERVTLTLAGERVCVMGHLSPPFACVRATFDTPHAHPGNFLLVHLPDSRVLATLASLAHAKAFATDLARAWTPSTPAPR